MYYFYLAFCAILWFCY